jgi:hypothetical protein
MALLPLPDITTRYSETDSGRPTTAFFNWLKQFFDKVSAIDTAVAAAAYSDGLFTPLLKFGGGSTGLTYSEQHGRYVRIGKLVNIWITIVVGSNGSSTGDATIEGLPFTAEDIGIYTPLTMFGSMASASLALASYMPFIATGEAVVQLYANDVSGGGGDAAPLTEANIVDGSVINIAGAYVAA